ncbi:hypothetical protein EKO04_004048 [Ascochyta lentis]|uniref:C2H2-type domain-containing protein n=1 Tax=Ascochyta lentis TaxID=205686 RepID=A0A8H7MJP9_9PLEO|nr:hypothetical protein EKO04_004048 [Ascochyta lentis]
MSAVNYTKTGRVSKAKKGMKVHECQCGRSYTRAEHLRRHQRNHAQEGALFCKYPDCGKTFFRTDLLQRHEERHSEVGNASRQPSMSSSEHSAHTSPMSMPATLPMVPTSTLTPTLTYPPQQILSPRPEVIAFSRYNPNLFRTPQLPRTPKIAPSNSGIHIFRSSPSFKTPSNDLKHHNLAFSTRHSISGPVLVDGVMNSGGHWHDSFAPSPYSCSSGYASPIPGPEYSHTYATPPYGSGMSRTRASSNASFIAPWDHGSQSPTSSVSNFQYSWPPEEKDLMASSFPYMPASYPAVSMPLHASVDPLGQYGLFCASNVSQLDHEEGTELFPREQYGMSQTARTYQFEQYLNNYWRLFDPTFPIIHRPTFTSLEAPPMLYAAMIAIGAYHSNDVYGKQVAAELHKTCIKLLDKRDRLNLTRWDRLCDNQAVFLVEVFAQYFAQRCAKRLAPRFMAMYKKLVGVRSIHPSAILGLTSLAPGPEDKVRDRWIQWAELSTRQHLLLSCYVLECQQFTLLARDREPSLEVPSHDLPFPAHRSLWDATSPRKWIVVAQQNPNSPTTVSEASNSPYVGKYDPFQSTVLIAAHYAGFSGPAYPIDADVEKALDGSPPTILQLRTAKLIQLVPIRALLAVSGETWVFGTKVTSEPEFTALRVTLQTWIGQLWSCTAEEYLQPTVEALRHAVYILKQPFESNRLLPWGLGSELSLFLAALVVWAATVAANSRLASSFSSQQSQLPLASHSSRVAMMQPTVIPYTTNDSSHPRAMHHLSEHQGHQAASSVPDFPHRRASIPYSEIHLETSRFLASAVEDITSFNFASCYHGCTSLLLWVKMALCGATSNLQESAAVDISSSGDFHGELKHIIVGQIERMLDHGWEGWGI